MIATSTTALTQLIARFSRSQFTRLRSGDFDDIFDSLKNVLFTKVLLLVRLYTLFADLSRDNGIKVEASAAVPRQRSIVPSSCVMSSIVRRHKLAAHASVVFPDN